VARVARRVVAHISMSLDNVLAIAGVARGSLVVLAIGLIVSVSLMATASTLLAKLLERVPSIARLELLIVAFVAFEMIWRRLYKIQAQLMDWPVWGHKRTDWRANSSPSGSMPGDGATYPTISSAVKN
jgi:predicted tellurium resistance membrane protein TerC